jgi:hypothetical protein
VSTRFERKVGVEAAARRAAAAVHERAKRLQDLQVTGIEYGKVITVVPELTVRILYPNVLDLEDSAGKGEAGALLLTEGPENDENDVPQPGHFRLSQTLRWWDTQFAIQPKDVLSMLRLPSNTWIAFDVRSDRNVNAGIRHNRPPVTYGDPVRPLEGSDDWELQIIGSGYSNGSDSGGNSHHLPLDYSGLQVVFKTNHVVKKMEVYDDEGVLIGFVPVFLTLPPP